MHNELFVWTTESKLGEQIEIFTLIKHKSNRIVIWKIKCKMFVFKSDLKNAYAIHKFVCQTHLAQWK